MIKQKIEEIVSNGKKESLSNLLQDALGWSGFRSYASALDFHYSILKSYRRSDKQTLGWLRAKLFHSGILSLCKDKSWRIDRTSSECEKLLGLRKGGLRNLIEYQSSSRNTALDIESKLSMEKGPGNCKAMYENTTLGIKHIGVADRLFFSLEGTLRNCVRPSIRFAPDSCIDALFSHQIQELWALINKACIFATTDAKSFQRKQISSAIQKLHDALKHEWGIVNLSTILEVNTELESILCDFQPGNDAHYIKSCTLYLLIDIFISKMHTPNGIGFEYSELTEKLKGIVNVIKEDDKLPFFKGDLQRVLKAAEDLYERSQKVIKKGGGDNVKLLNQEWRNRINFLQRTFSDIALTASRAMNNDVHVNEMEFSIIQYMIYLKNYLSRWANFIEAHRDPIDIWEKQNASEHMRRWFKNPWGIASQEDVHLALFDFKLTKYPAQEFIVMALSEVFEGKVDLFLDSLSAHVWIDKENGPLDFLFDMRILASKIFRCDVHIDDKKLFEKYNYAESILSSLSIWLMSFGGRDRLLEIESEPERVIDYLNSGEWVEEYIAKQTIPLTKRMAKNLINYRHNSMTVVNEFFIVNDSDFKIDFHIDIYPVEEFIFSKFQNLYKTNRELG